LIATVLLIAFAVALGAVVMNWGKTQLQDQILTEEECRMVKLDWFQRQGADHICYDDSSISMTVQNGAQREIDNLKLIVEGEKDILIRENILERPIGKAEPRRISIPYDPETIGSPDYIQLVPIISKGDRSMICPLETALKKQPILECVN